MNIFWDQVHGLALKRAQLFTLIFSLKRQNMQRLKESGFKNSICKYCVRIINR